MSDSASDDKPAEKSCSSKTKIKVDPSINDSPKKKRHVIKGNNIKQVGSSEKSKSSPLTKSFDFIGRLSKKGRTKTKNQLPLNESYVGPESTDRVEKAKCGDPESSAVVAVRVQQASPCSSSHVRSTDLNTKDDVISLKTDTLTTDSKPNKKGKKKGRSKKKETVKSHVLTEYYPVRRSSRKSKAMIEKEQTESIIEAIKNKKEDGLAIKEFKEKGRGVVAKRAFKKGTFVVEYAGELIDWNEAKRREEDYSKDSSVGCYMYYFVYNNTNYCVDATTESGRLGRLLNHSRKNPNCKTKLIPMPGIEEDKTLPRLIIIAKRDIGAGEELTYDYVTERL